MFGISEPRKEAAAVASRGRPFGPQFPEVHRVHCQLAYVSPYLVVRGHGVVNGLEENEVGDLESCGGLGVVRKWRYR